MAAKKIKLKINRRVFEKEVAKGRSSKVFKDLAYKKAEERAIAIDMTDGDASI